MAGILIHDNTMTHVTYDDPKALFGFRPITIIGACVERNLVYMGLKNTDNEPVNTTFPKDLLAISEFDDPPRGPVLIVKTHDDGTVVDEPFHLIQEHNNVEAITADAIDP
jgi:hypothetical protein